MKRKGKYICNRCGKVIDTKNDIDCHEVKAFQFKGISEIVTKVKNTLADEPYDDTKFYRLDSQTKYHFCGDCYDMLVKYVYGYDFKPSISEEIIRCRDCKKYQRDCPLEYRGRNDFYCGYAEQKNE